MSTIIESFYFWGGSELRKLTLQEMGEMIRNIRKEQGLRLEDLADHNISPATVSNIERGIAHVSPEKVAYLLKKLNLSEHHLPKMLYKKQQDLENLKFCFLLISTLNEIGLPDEALAHLNQLKLTDKHPLIAQVHYYKGKSLFHKKKWKQAERAFSHALHFSQQKAFKEPNIEASCYLYLGHTSYQQKNLDQALQYIEHGIKVFTENKGEPNIKYLLYLNKITYLKQSNRIAESYLLIKKIWKSIHSIHDIRTLIAFYLLRAELAQKTGLFEEAIQIATTGIKIAKKNQQFIQMFDLWAILGEIYMNLEDWERSRSCFKMVIRRKKDISDPKKLSSAYLHLSILNIKQKDFNQAYSTLHSALQYATQASHVLQLTQCYLLLGDLCFSIKKSDEAITYCQKGLDLAAKHNLKQKEYQFWLSLAKHWENQDEEAFLKCLRNIYRLQKDQFHFMENSNEKI